MQVALQLRFSQQEKTLAGGLVLSTVLLPLATTFVAQSKALHKWLALGAFPISMRTPQVYEKALTGVLSGLPDDQVAFLRQEFFLNFFKVAPTGQDFFKQSLTRLYYIAAPRSKLENSKSNVANSSVGVSGQPAPVGQNHRDDDGYLHTAAGHGGGP